MKVKRLIAGITAAVLSSTLFLAAPAAQAEDEVETTAQLDEVEAPLGNNALTNVLNVADYSFDSNKADFDVLTYLILDVMGAKPNSPVWALADGDVALTAFIPTDRAFQKLVTVLTGKKLASERKIYQAVRGLGINTVEKVLLYHVVVGAPILSGAAVAANGADLTTAEGSTIRVVFNGTALRLRDKDTKRANPNVILPRVDINAGNNQVAHPIDGVLLPKLG